VNIGPIASELSHWLSKLVLALHWYRSFTNK